MAKPSTPLPNRIRLLRKEQGLTLEQLAALIPPSTSGSTTDLSTIGKLERGALQLTSDWMYRVASGLGVEPIELLEKIDVTRVRRVPRIGKISAGSWREAIEDPIDLIPCTKGGPNTFALTPEGDSMDKIAPPGAVVFVDPDDIELVDGKYYAMMRAGDNDATFKQFRTNPLRLEPCSTNPAHKSIPLGAEPLVTIGRVVGQESDL